MASGKQRAGVGGGNSERPRWTRFADCLRSALPIREYGTCAGVRVAEPAEPRRLFDRLRPGLDTPERSSFEGALASVHRDHTQAGDEVVIVGGGYGITTVAAVRAGASVTVFEPDSERRAAIRRTLELNGVDPAGATVRDAVVGELNPAEADQKGVDPTAVTAVDPAALPHCDVLELDCEGAELTILQGLDADRRPRVIAVEVHPIKLDGAAPAVAERLDALGYDIHGRYTHDGTAISPAAYRDLLGGTIPAAAPESEQAFPPVLVAVREPTARD
jgi:hypothetical protein